MDKVQRSPYSLRNRGAIPRLTRYGQTMPLQSIQDVRRQRDAKTRAIRKRVNQLHELILARGSRTKLRYLQEQLQRVMGEAQTCHEQLMALIDEEDEEFNDDVIEELRIEVNNCGSNIDDHLQERQGEPPSRAASEMTFQTYREESPQERTRSWCAEHYQHSDKSDTSELTSQLQTLAFDVQNPDLDRNQTCSFRRSIGRKRPPLPTTSP